MSDLSYLHYAGDVRSFGDTVVVEPVDGAPSYVVPLVLGSDGFGRPYEVSAVTYDEAADRSTVELRPAEASTLRGHAAIRRLRADEFLERRPSRLAFAALFTAPPAATTIVGRGVLGLFGAAEGAA